MAHGRHTVHDLFTYGMTILVVRVLCSHHGCQPKNALALDRGNFLYRAQPGPGRRP